MTITVRGYTGIKPPKIPTEALQSAADHGFNNVCRSYDWTLALMVSREGKVDDNAGMVAIQGAYKAMECAYLATTVRGVYALNESPVSEELKAQFEAKRGLFEKAAKRSIKLHGGPGYYFMLNKFNPNTAVEGITCEWRFPDEGTPLREINHDVEKNDPVYQVLVKKASERNGLASESLPLLVNRKMEKDDYWRWHRVLIGEPDIQMEIGLQWDLKVSNPTEERPRVLYGDSRRQRIEMNKLAEKFLELKERD